MLASNGESLTRCLSVAQLAHRWGVSPRKVRAMIRRGKVEAFDVGAAGRQQLRISPESIAEAEGRLAVKPPQPRRRREAIDPEIAKLLGL